MVFSRASAGTPISPASRRIELDSQVLKPVHCWAGVVRVELEDFRVGLLAADFEGFAEMKLRGILDPSFPLHPRAGRAEAAPGAQSRAARFVALVEQQHSGSLVRGGDRGGEAGQARADDQEVCVVFSGWA